MAAAHLPKRLSPHLVQKNISMLLQCGLDFLIAGQRANYSRPKMPRPRLIELPDGSVTEAPPSLDSMDDFDSECDEAYEWNRQREIENE